MKAITGYKQKDFVEVAVLFEAEGLVIHRSIVAKAETEFDVFTISHVSGNAVIMGFDSLEQTTKCLQWIVKEAADAGYLFSTINGNIREERSDRRTKLLDIVRQARELFLSDDDDAC